MIKYKKAYDNSEMFSRFKTFCHQVDEIESHNAKKLSHTKALNQFSATTEAEWKSMMGFKPTLSTQAKNFDNSLASVKAAVSIDWSTQGAVTAVKNQGQCGSCWSFSTTGSVEGAWFLANHPLVSLSEQQIMDCSTGFGNQGCNGGLMDNAFQWIINNSGVTADVNDPYVSGSGTDPITSCQPFPATAKISSYKDVPINSEAALMAAVTIGPVSIAIEADQSCFQGYSSGVLSYASCACGSQLDHGVLVVGYGTDSASGLDFWKVKNSWGATWGESGYIRLQRGPGASQPTGGMCGILTSASYPIV